MLGWKSQQQTLSQRMWNFVQIDVVLVERGFGISEEAAMTQASFHIQPLSKALVSFPPLKLHDVANKL